MAHHDGEFKTIFEMLDNGARTPDNPALDWIGIARERGWNRQRANEYYQYATERIYG